jgi:uncharacterized protein with PhoU and TrkA domain
MFSRAAIPAPAGISDPEKVFGDLRIRTLKVAGGSQAAGKTLRELDAWKTYGVGILAIRRGTSAITAPAPDLPVRPGDFLILYGADENIQKFLPLVGGDTGDPLGDCSPATPG